jgi:chemotaxis response regulator CheB
MTRHNTSPNFRAGALRRCQLTAATSGTILPAAAGMRMVDRQADRERRVALVAIAGSAGSILPMRELLSHLPSDFPVPILYLQHLSAARYSLLAEILQRSTGLEVRWTRDGDELKPGTVYVCPSGSSFVIHSDDHVSLAPVRTSSQLLRSADRFFSSVAARYGRRAVAIVLSGHGSDGSEHSPA